MRRGLFGSFWGEIHFPSQTVNLRPWHISYILKATNVMVHLRYLWAFLVNLMRPQWTYISTTSEIMSCWGEVPCLSLIVRMQLFPHSCCHKTSTDSCSIHRSLFSSHLSNSMAVHKFYFPPIFPVSTSQNRIFLHPSNCFLPLSQHAKF